MPPVAGQIGARRGAVDVSFLVRRRVTTVQWSSVSTRKPCPSHIALITRAAVHSTSHSSAATQSFAKPASKAVTPQKSLYIEYRI